MLEFIMNTRAGSIRILDDDSERIFNLISRTVFIDNIIISIEDISMDTMGRIVIRFKRGVACTRVNNELQISYRHGVHGRFRA